MNQMPTPPLSFQFTGANGQKVQSSGQAAALHETLRCSRFLLGSIASLAALWPSSTPSQTPVSIIPQKSTRPCTCPCGFGPWHQWYLASCDKLGRSARNTRTVLLGFRMVVMPIVAALSIWNAYKLTDGWHWACRLAGFVVELQWVVCGGWAGTGGCTFRGHSCTVGLDSAASNVSAVQAHLVGPERGACQPSKSPPPLPHTHTTPTQGPPALAYPYDTDYCVSHTIYS